MSLTITLSGPTATELEARVALAEADFEIVDDQNHGLPEEPGEAFATVVGDDLDHANDSVRSLGWRLRQHHNTVGSTTAMPLVAVPPNTNRGQG